MLRSFCICFKSLQIYLFIRHEVSKFVKIFFENLVPTGFAAARQRR
jgi:hypothetical protein